MTDELSYADRTRIVKDWAAQFPEMSIDRRTMRIWKRIGPLLIYVSVYPQTRLVPHYRPQWAIHILYEKMRSAGSMGLRYGNEIMYWKSGKLPSNWDSINFEEQQKYMDSEINTNLHYNCYLDVANDIKQNSWIKTEGQITLEDIWQGVENYFKSSLDPYRGILVHDYEATIPIYTAMWAGETKKAREFHKKWQEWLRVFDKNKMDRMPNYQRNQKELDSRENHHTQILYYLNNPEELRQIVKDEVIAHKLEKVPYQNIAGAAYQE